MSLYSAMRSRYERTHASTASLRGGLAEAVVATRKDEARREALDVPLPRRRKRLIQVVDVEDEPSFGRGIRAEVEQMAVAARLHAQAGDRRARQVRRHVERRSPVEGERCPHHASVANGDQSGMRPLFDCSSNRNGFGRSSGAFQTACELRGHFSRRLLPISRSSVSVGRDGVVGRLLLCLVCVGMSLPTFPRRLERVGQISFDVLTSEGSDPLNDPEHRHAPDRVRWNQVENGQGSRIQE